jgi:predicted MFS family arabinose efflux permease
MFVGSISDRMQRKTLLSAVYLVRGLGFLSLIVFPGSVALWTFAVIAGGSWLATVPLTTSLTADVYGVRHVGTLGGLILMTHQLGGALAVILFGLAFDRWASYDAAYAVSVVLLLGAGVLALSIKEKALSARYAPVLDEPGSLGGEPAVVGG